MRLALIDGSNLYESARALGMRVDYKRLLNLLDEDGRLLRAYYFTALRDKSIESPVRKTVDWLSHNGYICITKQTTEFQQTRQVYNPQTNVVDNVVYTKIKGNVDVDITTYAFVHAPQVKEIWLFSGDGDFTVMVSKLQERYALKVYVISSLGIVSTELRKQADKFICLSDIKADIEKVG